MCLPQNSSFLFSSPGQVGIFSCIYYGTHTSKAYKKTPQQMTTCLSAESSCVVMMARYFLYIIFSYTEYIVSLFFADIQNCLQLNNAIFLFKIKIMKSVWLSQVYRFKVRIYWCETE